MLCILVTHCCRKVFQPDDLTCCSANTSARTLAAISASLTTIASLTRRSISACIAAGLPGGGSAGNSLGILIPTQGMHGGRNVVREGFQVAHSCQHKLDKSRAHSQNKQTNKKRRRKKKRRKKRGENKKENKLDGDMMLSPYPAVAVLPGACA